MIDVSGRGIEKGEPVRKRHNKPALLAQTETADVLRGLEDPVASRFRVSAVNRLAPDVDLVGTTLDKGGGP